MIAHTPRSAPTLTNQIEISPDLSNELLKSFRGLFFDPDLVNKIQNTINTMDNGIHKKLMEADLRRILHLIFSAEKVGEVTRDKLEGLMANIEDPLSTQQA